MNNDQLDIKSKIVLCEQKDFNIGTEASRKKKKKKKEKKVISSSFIRSKMD